MPQITGLQLLQTLAHPPRVILTTAYSEFALESYDYNVVDYLLKPIELPRFLKAVDKIIAVAEIERKPIVHKPPSDQSLVVKVDADWVRIPYQELAYIQSWGNYLKLFTPQQMYLASMRMAEVERRLPANQFMRIHKSYIVPLHKISRLSGNEVQIGSATLPVGQT